MSTERDDDLFYWNFMQPKKLCNAKKHAVFEQFENRIAGSSGLAETCVYDSDLVAIEQTEKRKRITDRGACVIF